ncbi:siderophore-interacting protein [Streptomyces anthocyanicus]|uniref:siderophore-interacting protein n=1 Tax=Streptomyces TaxID=1883 RepID=UPI0029B677C6|nr:MULTISPECIES: siderophore-interacting protein [unclassified Streptomyces]MDX3372674.1 siderophore-interacting protein [Streptomyces sp. ME02-6987-2C]MDX3424761.1 siderophore-interacting protein [Streptomyces sp. ME02-6985-2c]WTC09012.1 siderophore-interacting protein [Streptomyces anthocyanicus]
MTTAVAAPFRFFALQVVRTRRLGDVDWIRPAPANGASLPTRAGSGACSCTAEEGDRAEPWQPTTTPQMRVPDPAPPAGSKRHPPSPSLTRVTFAGPDLRAFRSDGLDQSLSLFLPHPGQAEPAVPVELGEGWWQGWRELPEDVRAVMRSYTLRSLRRDTDGHTAEIDVDFVLHGLEPDSGIQAGPAARWAADAAPGDRVLLLGPAVADNRAIRFRPPEDTDLVVIWGDETAVPAACAIVEALPAGTRARVWLQVPHAEDVQDLRTAADAEITWLVGDAADGPEATLATLRAAQLPPAEHPYVWIAGESGCVKRLRRHFVGERGVDRRRVTFVGYWRRGLTEEQLREQG